MTAVIGNFGYLTRKLDGQTIKTRLVCQLAQQIDPTTQFYDRQQAMQSKLSLLKMFWLVARAKRVLYLPAYGHLKWVFPLIWLVAKLCRTEIHYIVIGGWLSDFIAPLPLHRFMLRHIEGIYPETEIQKQELQKRYALPRLQVMRNFRPFSFIPDEHHTPGRLRLVFMARVTMVKGLPLIFALGDYLKEQVLGEKVTIDFYGQIEPADEDFFTKNIARYEFMKYCGPLQPDDIHLTLSRYDAMLLPTQHAGEGLPGSLIDSYIAGLPIIVTDWKYAREFVADGKTGIIVPYTDGQAELNAAIVRLLNDEPLLHQMKLHARKAAEEFSAEKAKEILSRIINKT